MKLSKMECYGKLWSNKLVFSSMHACKIIHYIFHTFHTHSYTYAAKQNPPIWSQHVVENCLLFVCLSLLTTWAWARSMCVLYIISYNSQQYRVRNNRLCACVHILKPRKLDTIGRPINDKIFELNFQQFIIRLHWSSFKFGLGFSNR